MEFHHSPERQLLADAIGRTFAQYGTSGHPATSEDRSAHWTSLIELGVVAGLFPERVGGFGGTGFDIAVIFEALGAHSISVPLVGTLMAARIISTKAHNEDPGLIEQMIDGSAVLGFAHEEPFNRYALHQIETTARSIDGQWRLTGIKAVVPYLDVVSHVVVSAYIGDDARSAGPSLFLLDLEAQGVTRRLYPLIDGASGGELILQDAPARLLCRNGLPALEEAYAAGIVALAWEAVGILDSVASATLDYLRTRKQFGVAIGKFQVLKHRMATVALEIEQARSAAINASAHLDGGRLDRERAVSAAKFTIDRVGSLVAEEAIQMHGGIGMTAELRLSRQAKRLVMIGHYLGDEDYHLTRFIELGLESAEHALSAKLAEETES